MCNIHDQILRGLADSALERAFAGEGIHLERGRSEVISDFIQANISASEYMGNIYAGNLQKYADCLLVKPK